MSRVVIEMDEWKYTGGVLYFSVYGLEVHSQTLQTKNVQAYDTHNTGTYVRTKRIIVVVACVCFNNFFVFLKLKIVIIIIIIPFFLSFLNFLPFIHYLFISFTYFFISFFFFLLFSIFIYFFFFCSVCRNK